MLSAGYMYAIILPHFDAHSTFILIFHLLLTGLSPNASLKIYTCIYVTVFRVADPAPEPVSTLSRYLTLFSFSFLFFFLVYFFFCRWVFSFHFYFHLLYFFPKFLWKTRYRLFYWGHWYSGAHFPDFQVICLTTCYLFEKNIYQNGWVQSLHWCKSAELPWKQWHSANLS